MSKWWSVCVVIVSFAAACADDEALGGAGAGGQLGLGGAGGELGEGGAGTGGMNDGGGGSPAAVARLRAVHLSPGAPAVDFCLVPGDGDAIGPVLEAASLPDGLAYPGATAYLEIPVASYAVRVLLADAADCETGVVPDGAPFAVAAGLSYSVAAIGMVAPEAGDAPFELALFEDDVTPESGKVRMRFIHASPDAPAVDVGLGSGRSFTPVWVDISYPDVGQFAGESYISIDPPSNAQISARATGTTTDVLVIDGVSIPPGEVVTSFAIGNLDGAPAPLKVLACLDVAGFCLELPAD